MSALGHKRTFAVQNSTSALPPKADIRGATRHVRFVPKADMCHQFMQSSICATASRNNRPAAVCSPSFKEENDPHCPSCCLIISSTLAFTASRLNEAGSCIGGNSIAVDANLATSCWTSTKRQNSRA